jgi:putative spermidine/putrescine transport system permease protein
MSVAAVSPAGATTRSRFRFGPLWLALPGLAFLIIFFLVPVARLMGLSFENADTGAMTAAHYTRIFDTDVYFRVLLITFRIAALTTLFSLLFGYPLAYWLSRLPERKRGLMILLVMVPFWTSYLVKSFAWVILLGRTGAINQLGLGSSIIGSPLEMLHNEFGVMIGMVHAMMPLAVLTMLPVMSGIDRRLTQASGTLGADSAKSFWLVYFPLSLPGAAAAGLLTFISSLGFFIVPALLGGRQQTMLAQLIIVQVQEILNWAFAGALAAMMLVAALITCWVYDRVFGLSSLSGDAGTGRKGKNGILRHIGLRILEVCALASSNIATAVRTLLGQAVTKRLMGLYCFLSCAFLMLPTLIVIPIAFTSSQFLEFPPPGFSLDWFRAYFTSDLWLSATLRSFGVAFATAIFATVIGGFAALALARSQSRWAGLIFAFFLAPMIVPRIVIAVGLFYLFAQIGLVATNTGLVIGHTVLALPFAFVAIAAVLKSYDWRLDQAAATLGANKVQALRFVTVPLIRSGLTAAFLFAFITSFDELTVAIFVGGGITTTLPKQMWDDMILQLNPTLAAVSVVVFLIVTTLLLAAEKLRRSS